MIRVRYIMVGNTFEGWFGGMIVGCGEGEQEKKVKIPLVSNLGV